MNDRKFLDMKKYLILSLVLVLFGGAVLGLFFQNTDDQDKKKKEEKLNHINVKDSNKTLNKQKEISGKSDSKAENPADIPFKKYKSIYKKSLPNIKFKNLKMYDCQGKKTVIEFIFLKKQRGEFVPFKLRRGFKLYPIDKKCNSSNTSHPGNSFRFLYVLGTDCKKCKTLIAGKKYKIVRHTDPTINDVIKMPEKEELELFETFPKNPSSENISIYRYPILAENLRNKSDQKKNEQLVKEKFVVEGIKETGQKVSVEYVMNTEGSQNRTYRFKKVDTGKWSGNVVQSQNGENIFGGAIVVASVSEEQQAKLIQYKKNVQQNHVNLSKNLDFNYDNYEWLERKVDMTRYIEQIKKNLHEQIRDRINITQWHVSLHIQDQYDIPVFASTIYKENGSYFVNLKAPEGTYKLKTTGRVLEENYTWPPE